LGRAAEGEGEVKPRDAANVTIGAGVLFLVYGAMGYFSNGVLQPSEWTRILIGTIAIAGGAIWRRRT
jgi:hypothetical protein